MYTDQSTPRPGTPSLPQNFPPRRVPISQEEHKMIQQRAMHHKMVNYDQPMMNPHLTRAPQMPRRQAFNAASVVNLAEGKIGDMNKFLTMARSNTHRLDLQLLYDVTNEARCEELSVHSWWERFVDEFFEDESSLRITGFFGGLARCFVVGKSLLGRYFRYCFENGLMMLNYSLRQPVTCYPRMKTMVVLYPNAVARSEYKMCNLSYEVVVSGTLELELNLATSRIRTFTFEHSSFRELIDKESLRMYRKSEQNYHFLFNNVTDNGLPPFILQFLEINTVMESMRTMMLHSKTYNIEPMEAIRALIIESQRKQQSEAHPYREIVPSQQLPSVESSSSIGRPTSAQSDSYDNCGGKKQKKNVGRRINTPTTAPRATRRRTKKQTPPGNESSPHITKVPTSPSGLNMLLVSEPKLYVMDRMSDDTKTIHRETNEVKPNIVEKKKDKCGFNDSDFDCFGDLV